MYFEKIVEYGAVKHYDILQIMQGPEAKFLYLLGGSNRAGKSTIANGLLENLHAPLIHTDSVIEGLRTMFTGDSAYKKIEEVALDVRGTIQRSKGDQLFQTSRVAQIDDLSRLTLLGMISYNYRNNMDLILEGSLITPEWVKSLNFPNYNIRAAFVGYTNPSHADFILKHAKQIPHDWINYRLKADGGSEEGVRAWITEQAEVNKKQAQTASELGYQYFDITQQPFDQYVRNVQEYFLLRVV